MKSYKELIDAVSAIEGQALAPQVKYVSMDLGGDELSIVSPRSYKTLLSEVTKGDRNFTPSRPVPAPKQKKFKFPEAVAMPQLITKPAEDYPAPQQLEKKASPSKGWGLPGFSRTKSNAETKGPQPPQLASVAASELSSIMKDNNIQQAPTTEQAYTPQNALVLPTLSIPDQVSELNKIIENIKKGGFDSSQMEIVKMEVAGLSKLIASQQSNDAPTADPQIRILRNAKLAEAQDMIKGS